MLNPFDDLRSGPVHCFADWAAVKSSVPTQPGVYSIWDGELLLYVGVAGRSLTGNGLQGRLNSHARGQRSGDQVCVYVADRLVLATLSEEQRALIADGRLKLDALVRDHIAGLTFRFAVTRDYTSALAIEKAIRGGALGKPPVLNALTGQRRP